ASRCPARSCHRSSPARPDMRFFKARAIKPPGYACAAGAGRCEPPERDCCHILRYLHTRMRRSWGCLCVDEVIAVVKIDRILAAPRAEGPSQKHCRAWNRVRPCSDDAPAECPGLLDAGPKPGPDRGVRSVVYRSAHGSAHFHAADLDRRLGGAGGGHGARSAWFRHPYRRGAPAVHPVWAVRCDRDAARGDFLDFGKKAIDGPRKSVTVLARGGAPSRDSCRERLPRRSSITAHLWTHPSRCPSS